MNCLHCAETLQILEYEHDEQKAHAFLSSKKIDPASGGLLTKAAVQHLRRRLPTAKAPAQDGADEVWGLPHHVLVQADRSSVHDSLEKPRRYSTRSNDTGYESLEELCAERGVEQELQF